MARIKMQENLKIIKLMRTSHNSDRNISNSKKNITVSSSVISLVILLLLLVVSIWAMFYKTESGSGARNLGWFGAVATTIEVNNNYLPFEKGAGINYVANNSPAQISGLQRGDIIVYIDNEKINSVGSLKENLLKENLSNRFNVTVYRNGRWEILSVRKSVQEPFAQVGNILPYSHTVPINKAHVWIILIIFVFVFAVIFLELADRAVIVGAGAVAAVIAGTLLGFYNQADAFSSINLSTLSLLIGMGLISLVLQEAGLFDYCAKRLILASGGDLWRLMVFFCVITYIFSCFVNNLTTILIIVPMTLSLADKLKFDPKPYIISEIISSNLGGASSMIGDFPNMLISSETGLLFHDFISYMMPICLILLFVLLYFIKIYKSSVFDQNKNRMNQCEVEELFEKLQSELPYAIKNKTSVFRGLTILCAVILAFVFSDKLCIPPAIIAITGGFMTLLLGQVDVTKVMKRFGFKDIIFFAGLFVLVGGVESSGFLDYISEILKRLAGDNVLAKCLLLMWIAGILTSFLNAGPSTMLFIPVVFSFGMNSPHNLYWWSLSLGVLAGSSALITGATAGQVASTMIEDFFIENTGKARMKITDFLTFREYAEFGVPVMFIFLIISSAYISILYYI